MRGWKPIDLDDFESICKFRSEQIQDTGYYCCGDKSQSGYFCIVTECRRWRKLGRADIKVSKITKHNSD
jgi:hypothetical protein